MNKLQQNQPLGFLQHGFFYSQLQGAELKKAREVYEQLYSAIRRHKKTLLIEWEEADEELMPRFLFLLLADHPELFYASAEWTTFCYGKGFAEIHFAYGFSKLESWKLERKLKQQAVRLAQMARNACGNDKVQQIKYLYHYLVTHISYAEDTLKHGKEQELYRIHSAVGALLDGSAVCDGIARGFKLILDELGIENRLIRRAIREDMEFDHEWNMVLIQEEFLHIDVTWEVNWYSKTKQVTYKYFMLTDEEMKKKHHGKEGNKHG